MSRSRKKTPPTIVAPPTEAVQVAYLSLQRTQLGLVVLLAICALLGLTVFRAPRPLLGHRIFMPVIFSTVLLTFAYTVRNSMVLPALDRLRRNPRDPKLLKSWSRSSLAVLMLCAAVGMMAFALQLAGAATQIVLTLYSIAIAYLFLLRPVQP